MDHDALEIRLARVEKFLDRHASGWREGLSSDARSYGEGQPFRSRNEKADDLVIDEEQTRRDRIALGFDPDPEASTGASGENDGSGFGDGRPSGSDGSDGTETPGPNTMPPSEAVAKGAANASPETEAALETQNDPSRASRAAEQRNQKSSRDAARRSGASGAESE